MSILVITPPRSRSTGVPLPRRRFRRLTAGATIRSDAAWKRKIGRAFNGVGLVLLCNEAAFCREETLATRLQLVVARTVALLGADACHHRGADAPPLPVDLVVADGGLPGVVDFPVIDADLADPVLTAALIECLAPGGDQPWRVYLLRCGDGSYYTGV
ncbi:MAG: hypothetical protein HQK87_11800, partial [Nitrospinae bacterium]|nr:hypothetical protein [Nitrospinota bacterium]